jgi:chromosome transmission fidelity protein 1
MNKLYQCIEKGQVGIFESPTGTGKSLSLICGALTWLRDHKRRSLDVDIDSPNADDDTPEWLRLAQQNERHKHLFQQAQELEAKLAVVRKQEAKRAREHSTDGPDRKRQRLSEAKQPVRTGEGDEQFMLADYDSEDEERKSSATAGNVYSANTQALLDKLKGAFSIQEEETEKDETKIIFCSRTHSQLTQFINELRLVEPPRSLPVHDSKAPREIVKHVPLGSRKNLCINQKVSSLGSAATINERCLELQKPGTAKEHKCKFLPQKGSKSTVEDFRNHALVRIRDIEDLGHLGQALEICPYYASRSAIAPSEIVTLPYPLLLQKSARDALGISLKDNVVIIDEAHNLMDAIAGLHTVSLTRMQLDIVTSQVAAYLKRFAQKLKGKNRVYVNQVFRSLISIRLCLETTVGDQKQCEYPVTAAQLMAGKGCDQIKPHKLIQYLQESKLAYKVEGYLDAAVDDSSINCKGLLMQFQSFLMVLMNPADEGRFFAAAEHGEASIRYTLLDPREHFRDIVEESRAVVLAGGTMSPVSDYADYLFSYLDAARLVNFSSGHVIPPSSLFTQAVVSGPTATEFLFDYKARTSNSLIMELRLVLTRICSIVPDGVVVFFPSYDYLSYVVKTWDTLSDGVASLKKYKQVFTETRSGGVEDLLREYTQCIKEGSGAVLLAVVGGKLSEGINFSDELGRAVVAVGLPFPNANGAEWKAKIEHVGRTKHDAAIIIGSSEKDAKAIGTAAGKDFYANACMRAVNQCIGRAIRHRNDYAAILLLDTRFATERIEKKLPAWIRDNMEKRQEQKRWADIEAGLKQFFADKKQSKSL